MRRALFAAAVALATSACASKPDAKPGKAWLPQCQNVGCIEARLMDTPFPIGTETSFAICKDQGQYDYRYVLTEAGWTLTSLRWEVVDSCP